MRLTYIHGKRAEHASARAKSKQAKTTNALLHRYAFLGSHGGVGKTSSYPVPRERQPVLLLVLCYRSATQNTISPDWPEMLQPFFPALYYEYVCWLLYFLLEFNGTRF